MIIPNYITSAKELEIIIKNLEKEKQQLIDSYTEESALRHKLDLELDIEKTHKQELIDYLKNLLENRYTNSKVVWFDSEYAKIYGELCTMAGANDDRLPLVPLSEIENILSKIEKR